jgi:hypothetical protein
MNTAGPTNVAHPNAKAPGCLAFLCVCHACRSCLCASLCQAIFSHKPSHVLAGVCRSWSNQQRKSKSKHKCLHHRIGTPERCLVACPAAQDCTPESVSLFMLPPLSTARRHRRHQVEGNRATTPRSYPSSGGGSAPRRQAHYNTRRSASTRTSPHPPGVRALRSPLSPVNERIRVRSQQLGQLGDVSRDPPRLVTRDQVGSYAPAHSCS